MADNQLAAEKKHAEEALERAEAELRRASVKIERQSLQIATLQGRRTGLKLASEEASHRGQALDIKDVKRFSAVPTGPPDFTDDALREMLDLAMQATDRRVREAVAEAGRARAESERAEAEGDDSLEQAFAKCKEPAAEHAARQATQAVLGGRLRVAKRLRGALRKLEEEAAHAQSAHAADVRSVGARLVAQRDAYAELVLLELQQLEQEGSASVAALMAERAELTAALVERDATIETLRAELAESRASHKEEQGSRRREGVRVAKEAKLLHPELRALERSLDVAERERSVHAATIAVELRREERGRAADAQAHAAQLAALVAERDAAGREMDAKLRAARLETRAVHNELSGQLKAHEQARQELERAHADELLTFDAEAQRERMFLRGKVDALGKDVRRLRSTNSRGRAMLYWTSMTSTTRERAGTQAPSYPPT